MLRFRGTKSKGANLRSVAILLLFGQGVGFSDYELSCEVFRGKGHLGRMTGLQGFYLASPVTSSPWQGNMAKYSKSMNVRRLVLFKANSMLPTRATNGDNLISGIGKRVEQSRRCEVAQAEASAISLDVWSSDRTIDMILPNEGDEIINVLENEVTAKCGHALEASSLIATVAAETKVAGTDLATRAQLNGQDYVQGPTEIAGMVPSECKSVSEVKKRCNFWQILENDLSLLTNAFEGFKEDLPSLNKTLQKAVRLRLWENPSAVQAISTPIPQSHTPGLSGLDLAVADFAAMKGYLLMAIGWLRGWQIPLEPCYDPQLIAAYFNRRPHVLLFRILQVSAVFGSAIFQLELEKFLNPAELTDSKTQRRGAELIKGALISLGPSFIKVIPCLPVESLGQSLSTRPDLIGAIPAKVSILIFGRTRGPISTLFCDLSERPVAAASFGQVYKGRTTDGQDVAVKVQRPDLLWSIALDIYILRMGTFLFQQLDVLRKVAKRRSDLKLYADELGLGFFGS
ncbi:hypothetical protein L7F22_040889 [Adiantum nelumboides]|nr:hypothetical protein [Adiantum nelumboides]